MSEISNLELLLESLEKQKKNNLKNFRIQLVFWSLIIVVNFTLMILAILHFGI